MVTYISIVLSFREGVHEVLNMCAGLKALQLFGFTFKILALPTLVWDPWSLEGFGCLGPGKTLNTRFVLEACLRVVASKMFVCVLSSGWCAGVWATYDGPGCEG